MMTNLGYEDGLWQGVSARLETLEIGRRTKVTPVYVNGRALPKPRRQAA